MSSSYIYFDSNVWYSQMVDDKHTEKAHRLFKEADENGITIVASRLVLLELFEVIRKRTIENSNFEGISNEKKSELVKKYENKRTEVAEKITKLWKLGKIKVQDPDNKIIDFYKIIYRYLLSSFGDIEKKDWCFDCKNKLPKEKYRYFGTGHLDIQHAMIARDFQIRQFFTFDKGFFEIKNNEDFKSLKIEIL